MKNSITKFNFCMFMVFTFTTFTMASWEDTHDGGSSGKAVKIFAKGNQVIAAYYSKDIMYSPNNGRKWTKANSQLPTKAMPLAFEICGKYIFVALDCDDRLLSGLYLTSDSCISWKKVPTVFTDSTILRLHAMGPVLLAGTRTKLMCSRDSGKTWDVSNAGLSGSIITSFTSDSSTNSFYVATDIGLFTTSDSAKSWKPINNSLPVNKFIIRIITRNDSTGLQILTNIGNFKFYQSSFGDVSWNDVSTNTNLPNGNASSIFSVGKNIFSTIYGAGGAFPGGLYITTNNGQNWYTVNNGLINTYVYEGAASDSFVFVGTDGNGVWRMPLYEVTTIQQKNCENKFEFHSSLKKLISHNGFVRFMMPLLNFENGYLVSPSGKIISKLTPIKYDNFMYILCPDVRDIASGIYILRILSKSQVKSVPFFVSK